MEYLLVHRGGRGQSIEYELLYSGDTDSNDAQLMGLLDLKRLKQRYDAQKSGVKAQKTAPSQGQVSPKSGGSQADNISLKGSDSKAQRENVSNDDKNAYLSKKNGASYRSHNVLTNNTEVQEQAHV